MTAKDVLIVGGGLGGLAAACTLAARDYRVTLFEKNEWVGGKACRLVHEEFSFDMGPTILTMPSVLKRIFAEADRKLEDYLEIVRLDPQWRCFYQGGATLDLVENVAAMQTVLQEFSGKSDAVGYGNFIEWSQQLHQISNKFFFWKSVENMWDTFDLKANLNLETLREVLALRMGTTVAGSVRKYIKDKKVAQMIDHFVQYVGSSPFGSPSVLCGIAHMQTEEGVWYPMGGTRAVAQALYKLATDLNVRVEFATAIRRISHNQGRVSGVETLDGRKFTADLVVSNMDSVLTHRNLLAPGKEAEAFLKQHGRREPACSGVVLFLGLKQRYDQLLHHNFVFSADPHEEFDWIYNKGEPAPDPSCYIAAPACTDPSVAPDGGEAMYVLVHTPYLREHHDWQNMFPKYRAVILNKLKETAGLTDLEERIVWESHLTPVDIQQRYNALNGAIYGLASHGRFTGAFKPGNRSKFMRGLYLAGGSAHPGPGMPMALMSGWIAADSLDQDHAPSVKQQAS